MDLTKQLHGTHCAPLANTTEGLGGYGQPRTPSWKELHFYIVTFSIQQAGDPTQQFQSAPRDKLNLSSRVVLCWSLFFSTAAVSGCVSRQAQSRFLLLLCCFNSTTTWTFVARAKTYCTWWSISCQAYDESRVQKSELESAELYHVAITFVVLPFSVFFLVVHVSGCGSLTVTRLVAMPYYLVLR